MEWAGRLVDLRELQRLRTGRWGGDCRRRMEEPGREGDSPGPPWAPSESSAFRAFVTAVGERAVASPSGSDNGDSVCSSNLRAVRKRPVRFVQTCTFPSLAATHHRCLLPASVVRPRFAEFSVRLSNSQTSVQLGRSFVLDCS